MVWLLRYLNFCFPRTTLTRAIVLHWVWYDSWVRNTYKNNWIVHIYNIIRCCYEFVFNVIQVETCAICTVQTYRIHSCQWMIWYCITAIKSYCTFECIPLNAVALFTEAVEGEKVLFNGSLRWYPEKLILLTLNTFCRCFSLFVFLFVN